MNKKCYQVTSLSLSMSIWLLVPLVLCDVEFDPFQTADNSLFSFSSGTTIGFWSVDYPGEQCSTSQSYTISSESSLLYTQFRADTGTYTTQKYLGQCPVNDNYQSYRYSPYSGQAGKVNDPFFYCESDKYVPLNSFTTKAYSGDQTCTFGIRLGTGKRGILSETQSLSSGFETSFKFIVYSNHDRDTFGKLSSTTDPVISMMLYKTVSKQVLVNIYPQGTADLVYTVSGTSTTLVTSKSTAKLNVVDGMHTVKVIYSADPKTLKGGNLFPQPSTWDYMSDWSETRTGEISVFIDDMLILNTFVNIPDLLGLNSLTGTTSSTSKPGLAKIGFKAGTSIGVIVNYWKFQSFDLCRSSVSVSCGITGEAVIGRFLLKNVGKHSVNIEYLSGLYERDGRSIICSGGGSIDWDSSNSYFMGCERYIEITESVQQIVFTSGIRTLTVTSDRFLYTGITSTEQTASGNSAKKRSSLEYCIKEDPTDSRGFIFGFCDCSYCATSFQMMKAYGSKNSECLARLGNTCNCFEVSSLTWSTSASISLDLTEMATCTDCKFDSHCNYMLKTATCNQDSAVVTLGNPMTPDPTSPGFSDRIIDNGLVTSGKVKGDTCDCGDEIPGSYLTVSGTQQTFNAHLLRNLIGSKSDCIACLVKYSSSLCEDICGPKTSIKLATLPSGENCATCAFSSPKFQELTILQQTDLKECFKTAVRNSADPWVYCNSLALSTTSNTMDTTKLFSGLATHFLVECPSRNFGTYGAVCVPNVAGGLSSDSDYSVISETSAKSSFLWQGDTQMCINSNCELVGISACSTDACICGNTVCPIGINSRYPGISIPCSGNGICRTSGSCKCRPGYSGLNCQTHCESAGGCCATDDDCPYGKQCSSSTLVCS
jgi:hypothetical protein